MASTSGSCRAAVMQSASDPASDDESHAGPSGGSCARAPQAAVIRLVALFFARPRRVPVLASLTATQVPDGQSASVLQGAPGSVAALEHWGRHMVDAARTPVDR